MKHFLLSASIALLAIVPASARIVTSQNNGNATNPFTWNCTCIPVNGDTIIINHAVTLDVDYAFTMGGIQINAGGSLTGNANNRIFGVSGGYFLNNGTLNMAYVYHNGGTFTNNGTITCTRSAAIDQAINTVNVGTFSIVDTLLVGNLATFWNFGTFISSTVVSSGAFSNSGSTTTTDFWTSGTVTHNGGNMLLYGNLYNSGNITLNAATNIALDIYNVENITVNYYLTARSLFNGDSIQLTAFFTNNAVVSLSHNLLNSEDLNGNGHYCVADTTANSGNVNGTLDICDQTGGGWDFNFGTEAGTVTHCASGPCSIGIPEVPQVVMNMAPNPANELLNINLSQPQNGMVRVTDVTGRVVMEQEVNGSSVVLNVSNLTSGVYSVTVVGADQVSSGRFVKE